MMKSKPNIVFILSDDQGAWAMHCAGNKDLITPNLDRLANMGVRFDNFFCASPVCSPARASIVTGEIPSCHGVHDWIRGGNIDTAKHFDYMKEHPRFKTPDTAIEYLEGHPSYITELYKNGYRCGLSGKWHLGNNEIPKTGFEKWFTIGAGGCSYYRAETVENGKFKDETKYITDVITDKALEELDDFLNDKENPFYLSVHYTAPHTPWDENNHPKEFIEMYRDCEFKETPVLPVHKNQNSSCSIGDTEEKRRYYLRGYYASISAMDYNIGKILDKIEASDQADNTIIVFTGDNGMNLGHHGIWGKGNGTYPPNMYDTSVKVPLIMYSPKLNSSFVENTMLCQLDFFPTLLEMVGINYETSFLQPGRSFSKIFEGEKIEDNEELVVCDEYGFVRMLRNKTHKIVLDYKFGENFFFDLVNDPNEDNNLINSNEHTELIAQMKANLEAWFKRYSVTQNDGKNSDLTGAGQMRRPHEENAFSRELSFYHKDNGKI